jgi:hypothetical protein
MVKNGYKRWSSNDTEDFAINNNLTLFEKTVLYWNLLYWNTSTEIIFEFKYCTVIIITEFQYTVL